MFNLQPIIARDLNSGWQLFSFIFMVCCFNDSNGGFKILTLKSGCFRCLKEVFGPGPSFLGTPDLYKTVLNSSSPHCHNTAGNEVSAYTSGQQLSQKGPGSPNSSSSLPNRVGGPSPPTGFCLHSSLFTDTPSPLLFKPHKSHLQHRDVITF